MICLRHAAIDFAACRAFHTPPPHAAMLRVDCRYARYTRYTRYYAFETCLRAYAY